MEVRWQYRAQRVGAVCTAAALVALASLATALAALVALATVVTPTATLATPTVAALAALAAGDKNNDQGLCVREGVDMSNSGVTVSDY